MLYYIHSKGLATTLNTTHTGQQMRKFITTAAKTLVAVVALAAITNCGVTPDETVTYDTATTPAPSAPATPVIDEPTVTVEVVYDLTYVCMMEGHPHDYVATDGTHNVYEPMTMNLLHTGVLGNTSHNKRLIGGEMFCAIVTPETVCGEDEVLENGECILAPITELNETLAPQLFFDAAE